MPLRTRVTLRQIAERAGVSVACVSHALRGEKNAAPKTQARIQALAEGMGYRPDPILAALGSRAFRSPEGGGGVPLMLLSSNRSYLKSQGAAYLIELNAVAPQYGYRILHENICEPGRIKSAIQRWHQKGVRGVFITDHYSELDLTQVDWCNFPVIFFGGFDDQNSFDTIKTDVTYVTHAAWQKCFEYGYQRIGAAPLCHPAPLLDDLEREGLCESYSKRLPVQDRVPVLTARIGDEPAFIEWYRQYRPEAIIGFNHLVSHWIDNLGLRMPEDCGFISLNVTRKNQGRESGPLLNDLEIAKVAVERMDWLIRHKLSGKPSCGVRIHVPPSWHDGTTLVPRAAQTRIQ